MARITLVNAQALLARALLQVGEQLDDTGYEILRADKADVVTLLLLVVDLPRQVLAGTKTDLKPKRPDISWHLAKESRRLQPVTQLWQSDSKVRQNFCQKALLSGTQGPPELATISFRP